MRHVSFMHVHRSVQTASAAASRRAAAHLAVLLAQDVSNFDVCGAFRRLRALGVICGFVSFSCARLLLAHIPLRSAQSAPPIVKQPGEVSFLAGGSGCTIQQDVNSCCRKHCRLTNQEALAGECANVASDLCLHLDSFRRDNEGATDIAVRRW